MWPRKLSTERYPWGGLSVEQDILRNWDASSTESIESQRRRLIKQHLDADLLPQSDTEFKTCSSPLQLDVDAILRPWRSEKVRTAAIEQLEDNDVPLMLRTHYNRNMSEREVDDAKLADWVQIEENFSDEADWACLDDPELFDFGEEWQRIFYVIPELTHPYCHPSGHLTRRPKFPPTYTDTDFLVQKTDHDWFKRSLQMLKKLYPEKWRDDPLDLIHSAAGVLHRAWCTRPLVVVDKEAFETGNGRLIYIDSRRNIIRETRFALRENGLLEEIIIDWFDISYKEWLWDDSEVGEKYRVDGEFGQALYQMTDEDWADPEPEPLVTEQE